MWIRGKASIAIAAAPEAIWEWLVDRERMPHGPSEARIELLEFDPSRRMVVSQQHDLFRARAVFELSPGAGGTRVTSSARIRYRSLMTWLGEELKQLIEEGAT